MGIFDGILGLKKTEERLSRLEERLDAVEELLEEEHQASEEFRKEIIDLLSEPRTTSEIAEKLGRSRSWTSIILNLLEREGKVRESGKKGRELLYARI